MKKIRKLENEKMRRWKSFGEVTEMIF